MELQYRNKTITSYRRNFLLWDFEAKKRFQDTWNHIFFLLLLLVMRCKAAIILFYFLGLFLVPCSDAQNICETPKELSIEIAHSHNQDTDDNCTPFCQCECCSVTVVSFNFELPGFVIPIQTFSSKKVIIRDSNFLSRYAGSIWQPPKFNI
ncbi:MULTISPECIES: DUF6660 family protein [Sphingobacterium]|uniref:DUF6660 family protein n=2 Tax=Sphingobacterium TaxID=28453 RepID=UPI0011131C47|nr:MULTISPECIES: DUF6660 family protein [Sphingobacterium]